MGDVTLRVLHVIDSLGGGGAERSLAEMLPGLVAAGIASEVAVFHERVGVSHLVDAPVHVLPGGRAARVRALRRLLGATRPDVVHSTLFEADVAARVASAGRPEVLLTSLVNTSYEPERMRADPNLRPGRLRAAQLLDAATARRVDHFHAITQAVADAAVRRLRIRRDRITVIPRGRDAARLGEPGAERRARVRAAIGIASDAALLLHTGRLEYQKGHGILLDAVDALARQGRAVTLLLAGADGNASAEVDRRITASAGLTVSVRRLGFRDDLPDLLCAADAFVFPSVYEGLGGALLEAMALGVPVVATDLPAHREVLGPAGLLVAPTGPALAAGVARVLDDHALAGTLADAGRRRFVEHFTLDQAVARHADLYRRLAGRR